MTTEVQTPFDHHERYSIGRVLDQAEYDLLIQKLLAHYQKAKSEIDTNEYYNSLPAARREAELEQLYKTSGRPIGGFGSMYIGASFYRAGGRQECGDAFASVESFKAFAAWLEDLSTNAVPSKVSDRH